MPEFTDQEKTLLLLALWSWADIDPTLNAKHPTHDEDETAWGLRSMLEAIVTKLGGRPQVPGFGVGLAESN